MDFYNLTEIEFVSADADTVKKELVKRYQDIAGRKLAPADPVLLFLSTIAAEIVLLKNQINETGKQNLLRYASGDNLEHLGALFGIERMEASKAITTIKITLSAERNSAVSIPAGTRFTAGDNVFFALDSLLVIGAGDTEGLGQAVCMEAGAKGNGYAPNTLNTLVDPVGYVASVTNTTISEGGAVEETDAALRERIRQAPEKFSCAGPSGAYEYWAKSVNTDIADVSVISPTPGHVEIRPLLVGGVLPGTELLDEVEKAVNDRSIRPLTDQISVLAPTSENYNIDFTYYIDAGQVSLSTAIQAAVEKSVSEYRSWQEGKLGRDINPSELVSRVMQAGAKRVVLTAPNYKVIDRTKVAQVSECAVRFGGLEDE